MATQKQHAKFNKDVEKLLIEKGATENIYKFAGQYKWQIATKYGILILTVHEPSKCPIFSVYTQFAEYEKYESELKENHFRHWKWNVHQDSAELALQDLHWRLNSVTN